VARGHQGTQSFLHKKSHIPFNNITSCVAGFCEDTATAGTVVTVLQRNLEEFPFLISVDESVGGTATVDFPQESGMEFVRRQWHEEPVGKED
jgi:hypothetical protein